MPLAPLPQNALEKLARVLQYAQRLLQRRNLVRGGRNALGGARKLATKRGGNLVAQTHRPGIAIRRKLRLQCLRAALLIHGGAARIERRRRLGRRALRVRECCSHRI